MATSKPVIPPQPEEVLYGPDKLQLFPRLTRATYREKYGVEPPPWDKAKRIKRWFDTSVLEGVEDAENHVVQYEVFDATRPRGVRVLAMTAAEAAAPNLPGAAVYPKYVVAPTPAVIVAPISGEKSGVNPEHLSDRAEAVALAAELGLDAAAVRESSLAMFVVYWNGERRRPWVIEWKGSDLQVSLLLRMRYANGVGAPGRWDVSGTSPVWVPEAPETGEQDMRPEIPIPVRPLLPNERIVTGFGGIITIQREDLRELSDRELLERIDRRVEKLSLWAGGDKP